MCFLRLIHCTHGNLTRPGGIDKLPADFKPKFNFILSESASSLHRAAKTKDGWRRPKPFEMVDLLTSNRLLVDMYRILSQQHRN